MTKKRKSFGDYKAEGSVWITLTTGEYYPDILEAIAKPRLSEVL